MEIPGEQPIDPGPLLILDNTEDVTQLGTRLGGVKLIVLAFPTETDGRAYSQARLLRERMGYTGALRAAGQISIDQLPFMLRCGFDSFATAEKGFTEALAQARLAVNGQGPVTGELALEPTPSSAPLDGATGRKVRASHRVDGVPEDRAAGRSLAGTLPGSSPGISPRTSPRHGASVGL
jgi:hypothetical protein